MNRRALPTRLALAATALAAAPAFANGVYWSIGISSPGVSTTVSNARPIVYVAPPPVVYYPAPPVVVHPPVVYHAPPVMYQAPPVMYQAPPVIYGPPRVIYQPAPVVVYPHPRGHWKEGKRGEYRHQRDWERASYRLHDGWR